jgi:hypothetical protein
LLSAEDELGVFLIASRMGSPEFDGTAVAGVEDFAKFD